MMDKKEKGFKQIPGIPLAVNEKGEVGLSNQIGKTIYDKLTKKKVVGRGGRPKGMTKRTIDRYKKVYRQFTVLQKKYTAKKKSELYELCSIKEYDGKSYSRNTIRNIIEDKKYNLKPT